MILMFLIEIIRVDQTLRSKNRDDCCVVCKCSILCMGPGVCFFFSNGEALLEYSQTWHGRQVEDQERFEDCCYDPV